VPNDARTGSYLARVAVYEGILGNSLFNRFDYKEDHAFTITRVPTGSLDGEITSYTVDYGQYAIGETVHYRITVKNTGGTDWEFYQSVAERYPDGSLHYSTPFHMKILKPGESKEIPWEHDVRDGDLEGSYAVFFYLYSNYDGSTLSDLLDSEVKYDAFLVTKEPLSDSDEDRIADAVDSCPREAETKNGYQDRDGCPDISPDKPIDITITQLMENYAMEPDEWVDKQVRTQGFVAHGHSGIKVADSVLFWVELLTEFPGLDEYFHTEGIRLAFELTTFYMIVGDSPNERHPYPYLAVASFPVPLYDITNDDLGTFIQVTGRIKQGVGDEDSPATWWFQPDLGGVMERDPPRQDFVSLPNLAKSTAYEGEQVSTFGQVIERKTDNNGMIRLIVNYYSIWVLVPDNDLAPKLGSWALVEGTINDGKLLAKTVKTRPDTLSPISKNEGCPSFGNADVSDNKQDCLYDDSALSKSAKLSIDVIREVLIADDEPVDTGINLSLENTGDSTAVAIRNEFTGTASGWVTEKPDQMEIKAHDSTSTFFRLHPPYGAKPGSYTIAMKFIGKDAQSGAEIATEANIKILIPERSEWSLTNQRVCTAWYFPFTEFRIWEFCDALSKKDLKVRENFFVKVDVNNLGNIPLKSVQGTLVVPDGITITLPEMQTTSDIGLSDRTRTLEWTLKPQADSDGSIDITVETASGVRSTRVLVEAR
jgi:hypothetical protein